MIGIAPTIIEPVTVNARKMYRVKLGPIASVASADSVLEKVIQAGNGGARVVKAQKQ
jgi:rare lipoprotein A